MSDKHQDPLASLFEDQNQAKIDPHAKKRAMSAAMQAFEAAKEEESSAQSSQQPAKPTFWQKVFQGFSQPLRPTDNNNGRRSVMTQQTLWRYGAGASFACILMFAVLIGIKPNDLGEDPTTEIRPVNMPELQQDESAEYNSSLAKNEQKAGPKDKQEQASRPHSETQDLAAAGAAAEARSRAEQQVIEERQELVLAERDAVARKQTASATPPRNTLETLDAPTSRGIVPQAPPTTATQLKREARAVHSFAKPQADIVQPPAIPEGRDRFTKTDENGVKRVVDEPVSTFSIDVDTASYAFVRRQLNRGVLPQKDAVRVEEMINYFDYQYPLPENKSEPFSSNIVVSDSPWRSGNKLIHIGIKGYEMDRKQMPKTNLVFLLDVSGSMNSPDKLPLVKQSMALLLDQLDPEDSVAIAVYAGAAGTVLEPTPAKEKQKILNAMNQLSAGGSTAGAQGIELAYQLAQANFDKQAVNRVILATDGDFNVGITNPDELKGFVERKRESGVFLSVLGFGQGNYHDHMMQQLAQNGNGIAAYIDTLSEAQKVLVEEATSSLFPIAKDVKVQVEFNPATVSEYRLIGYETRKLNREDFNNDKVDAGDIGAGHTVTAIYEITPATADSKLIDENRYASNNINKEKPAAENADNSEYGFVKLRYKLPQEDQSKLISRAIPAKANLQTQSKLMQRETQFSTAVAGFAQILKGGKFTGQWGYDDAIELALANRGEDVFGYRNEFVQLIRKAAIAK